MLSTVYPKKFTCMLQRVCSVVVCSGALVLTSGSVQANEPPLGSLSSDIDRLVEQAQRRQDSLDRLPALQRPAQASGSVLMQIMAADPVPNARLTSPFGSRIHPVRGTRHNHSGIDLAAPTGTPIFSTADGVVTRAGWQRGYGNVVVVEHGGGYETLYAHAQRIVVRVGDRVSSGQQVATVGCTGTCTGPHLHYEVRSNNRAIDPSRYLALVRDDVR